MTYFKFWHHYFGFKGKASRKEFWITFAVNSVIQLIILGSVGTKAFTVLGMMLGNGGTMLTSDYQKVQIAFAV